MKTLEELLKPIMIDYDSLKKGDEVFDVILGETLIKRLDSIECPIITENGFSYTRKGEFHPSDGFVRLYKQNPFEYLYNLIQQKEEWQPRWMWVSDDKDKWEPRYVIGKFNDFYITIAFAENEEELELYKNDKPVFWEFAKEIEKDIKDYSADELYELAQQGKLKII